MAQVMHANWNNLKKVKSNISMVFSQFHSSRLDEKHTASMCTCTNQYWTHYKIFYLLITSQYMH